ncbi:3587_t:CDS:2, partial [Gigaspora margarita]
IHNDEESNCVEEINSITNDEMIYKQEAIKEIISDRINIEETNNSIRINKVNKKKASLGMHGKDGLPGEPGGNGGHFYAKGRNFINLSSLIIDISGGDGGKGQDGGNGADGLCGPDSGKEMVENKEESALVSRKKVSGATKEILEKGVIESVEKGFKFFFTFNDKYKEVYEVYNPGQEGGNGGRGGVGGNKGSHGTVYIEPNELLKEPTIIKENNEKGINGEDGLPGRGGKNGPKYCGIYINEISYSGFKVYKEFDSESNDSETRTVEIADSKEIVANCTDERAITLVPTSSKESDTESIDSAERTDSKKSDTNSKNDLKATASRFLTSYLGSVAALGYSTLPITKEVLKIGSLTGASLVAGLGVSLGIPLVISPVSAHFSSYWEEKPHKLDDKSFVSDGKSPSPLNDKSKSESSLPKDEKSDSDYSKKLSDYNEYYKNNSQVINVFFKNKYSQDISIEPTYKVQEKHTESKRNTYPSPSSYLQDPKSPNSNHASIEAQFGILGLVRYYYN